MAIMSKKLTVIASTLIVAGLMSCPLTARAAPVTGTSAIKNAVPNDLEAVRGRVIVGGFIAGPYFYGPPYYYGAPYPYGPPHYGAPYYYSGPRYNFNRRIYDAGRNCRRQYGSFNPSNGTYVGSDGLTHPCPVSGE